jgi:hypothetical protein
MACVDVDLNYVEWLSEVERVGGEFAWVRQARTFPSRDGSVIRTPAQLNTDVLKSPAVKVESEDIFKLT